MDLAILLVFEIKLEPTLASIFLTSVLTAVLLVVIVTAVTCATVALVLMGSMAFMLPSIESNYFQLKSTTVLVGLNT